MTMETTAWTQLHSVMNAQRSAAPSTGRRCAASAPSPARTAAASLCSCVLSVVTAFLAVATPVLAGRVVDAIVSHGDAATVVHLALLIARHRGRSRRRSAC